MARGIFISGTDTDVGKTAVATAILRQAVAAGLACRGCKPVASGVGHAETDAGRLWLAAGKAGSPEDVCPQSFQAAIAPTQAAAAEGRQVDDKLLRTCLTPHSDADLIVVEGAGGLFSPLSDVTRNADLARDLGLPVVVVDSVRLGAIGRTLATVTAARAVGLHVAAVVLSVTEPLEETATSPPDSRAAIAHASLAELRRWLPDLPVSWLAYQADEIEPKMDWYALAAAIEAQ
jgi:dethiobiotin synthetase